MTKLPHVTVATVVERDNQFLMVKEQSDGNIVYNQPAGHLKANETLIQLGQLRKQLRSPLVKTTE